MPWPTTQISTANLDSGRDSPSAARKDLLQAVEAVNSMISSPVQSLGSGQTWQNVTSSRALDTTYTNSTGKPISVSVQIATNTSAASDSFSLKVSGVDVAVLVIQHPSDYVITTLSAIVPDGATYQATKNNTLGGGSLFGWKELR